MKDIVEKALLSKCIVCSVIYACWFNGRYKCDECSLRGKTDCPKNLPSTLKDYSGGICDFCLKNQIAKAYSETQAEGLERLGR